jgi:hypothetical protein
VIVASDFGGLTRALSTQPERGSLPQRNRARHVSDCRRTGPDGSTSACVASTDSGGDDETTRPPPERARHRTTPHVARGLLRPAYPHHTAQADETGAARETARASARASSCSGPRCGPAAGLAETALPFPEGRFYHNAGQYLSLPLHCAGGGPRFGEISRARELRARLNPIAAPCLLG